jgi:hypothetical protein
MYWHVIFWYSDTIPSRYATVHKFVVLCIRHVLYGCLKCGNVMQNFWSWFGISISGGNVSILFIKSSACSITVSNTTCYCNHTILLLVFIYICVLEWFIFSRYIEFIQLMNCFKYLLVSSLLLTGQLPSLSTLVFRVSLSFFSLLHWNIRWFTVCMLCLHGHSGLPIHFNRCKYDRIFPCPVIIVVTFGLKFIFTASLFSTLGKTFFSNHPFRCFLPLTLPFSYASFPGILFYSAFWCPSVRYIVILSCLVRKTICYFISENCGVSFHPFKIYFPVLFVQGYCSLPDFFYVVVVISMFMLRCHSIMFSCTEWNSRLTLTFLKSRRRKTSSGCPALHSAGQ